MQSNITPQDLSRMLQSEGYKAKIILDEEGNEEIHSASSGLNWKVRFRTFDSNASGLSFNLVFWLPDSQDPIGFCNSFNRDFIFGKAWYFNDADDDGERGLFLQQHLDLSGGVSEEWLTSEIYNWISIVDAFWRRISELG
jgi:hypothetical protein